MMRNRWAATAVALLLLSTAALAAATPDLEGWIETDRASYRVGEPVRVAFCIRNNGPEDVDLVVAGPEAQLRVGALGVLETPSRSADRPEEILIRRGETTVYRFDIDPSDLDIPAGTHQIVGALQPLVGAPIQAVGQFVVGQLPDYLKVADVLAAPHVWADGDVVELRGEYRGNRARPFRPLDGVEAPRATDWILGDETGEIYIHNAPSKEHYNDWTWHIDDPYVAPKTDVGTISSPVLLYNPPEVGDKAEFLHPGWTYGKRVIVRGHVITHDSGLVTVAPVEIFKWQTDRGAFCVLETEGPPQTEAGPSQMLLRMIVKNDTAFPLTLAFSIVFIYDFFVERDGEEVWRWSRHQGMSEGLSWMTVSDDSWKPGPNSPLVDRSVTTVTPHEGNRASGRSTVPPDNALVYTAYWPLVDNDGRPVEPGVYQISGLISHRVFTYPVPVVVGHAAALP